MLLTNCQFSKKLLQWAEVAAKLKSRAFATIHLHHSSIDGERHPVCAVSDRAALVLLKLLTQGNMKKVSLLAVLAFAFCAWPLAASALEGRVISVADGDTITILTANHEQVRVRLAEIDAPEGGQPWGRKAKEALSDLVMSRVVSVKTRGQDQYGRTLGKVYAGGTYVNAEMVRSGAAWAYRDYLTDYSLISLETEAHKAKRGLWAMPANQTVAPWDWRHHRQSQPPRGSLPQVAGMQCGMKRYCRQMTSCDEARYYWQYCGVSSLDGDGDGRPCEILCRQ
jgi:endonuclease YncB( thermonuclease family)